uniref:Putative secreted protein n=1 Tax=Anopheles marajoara TaxID=58244 RepID=A0A2M4C7G0_9DIPT
MLLMLLMLISVPPVGHTTDDHRRHATLRYGILLPYDPRCISGSEFPRVRDLELFMGDLNKVLPNLAYTRAYTHTRTHTRITYTRVVVPLLLPHLSLCVSFWRLVPDLPGVWHDPLECLAVRG